jgi:hypothetical protein
MKEISWKDFERWKKNAQEKSIENNAIQKESRLLKLEKKL